MKARSGCSRQVCNLAEVQAVQAIPLTVHQPLSNVAELIGKVAVVQRGDVSFVEKARVVQAAGAVAMICVNSDDVLGRLVGSGPDITIPCVCIKSSDLQSFAGTAPVSLRLPLVPEA